MSNLLAKTPEDIFGRINAPSPIQPLVDQGGAGGLSIVLGNAIVLIFRIGIILFVFMVVISAIQWILSGGDKEAVASARGRLTSAVIGLVILGLAWVITTTVGNISGVDLPFR